MSESPEFMECMHCKGQSGTPVLCASCQHNRSLISELKQKVNRKSTGTEAVLRMRDDFLQLVAAYNAVHSFDAARDAQAIAVALHTFEDDHALNIEWPARVVDDDDGKSIVEFFD